MPVTFNEIDVVSRNPIVLKLFDRKGQAPITRPHIHLIFFMYPSATLSLKSKNLLVRIGGLIMQSNITQTE